MKAVVIRVNKTEVLVDGGVVSSIGKGMTVLVGLEKGDDKNALEEMAQKIVNLRIFEDDDGKLNYSVKDKNYAICCVSNFTLCANTSKGRRPSFEMSMPKEEANKFFEDFLVLLRARNIEVKTGAFGEHMDIRMEMDGPVNIPLEI
jgi:D-tyrosyl-tRNA(Tyr) deacylase